MNYRVHDFRIPSAAAQDATQGIFNVAGVRIAVAVEQIGGRHQHAGRTDAALRGAMYAKCVLQRGQLPISRFQSFDRNHIPALYLGNRYDTGANLFPIDQNCAGAAVSFGAAFFGAGQPLVEPQEIQQCLLPIEGIQCNFLVAKQTAECRSCGCHRLFGQTRQLPR